MFLGQLQSQQVPITLKLVNPNRDAIPFASFTVINRADSTQVINRTGDSSGTIRVNLQLNGQYIVQVSSVNYKPLEKGITVRDNQRFFTFATEPDVRTLATVSVTAERIVMRQEDDKTIIEADNLAASSTNTYEVLEKTPGLFIDQDGRIYLNGTTPASVLINGRDFRMSAADMSAMLKSLPPDAVARIEIVRTPSAKYDAASSGGLVNVVLKKGVRIGLTGSLSAGFNQGVYGNQFAGINLNQNNGKLNAYLNTQFTRQANYNTITMERLFNTDSLLYQDTRLKLNGNLFYLGTGFAYDLGDKWEIGYDGRLSLNANDNVNEAMYSNIKKSTGNVFAQNNNYTADDISYTGVTNSITTKYKIDSAGSEWTTDWFYSYTNNRTDQLYTSVNPISSSGPATGSGDLASVNNLFVGQTDYRQRFKKNFVLEAGIKLSALRFRSDNLYFRGHNGGMVKDVNRTASYRYNENINAAYLQLTKTISKVVIKTGVRYEHTRMEGNQTLPQPGAFTVKRGDFFPYVYLSRDLFPVGGYMVKTFLIYRRSVARPDYEYLNPAPRYIDPYNYETGNPSLRPQFVQNAEANVSVANMPLLAVGINHTSDVFSSVIYQADTNRSIAYRTYENIGKNKEYYLRGMCVIPPKGRYFFLVGAQYNHSFYTGVYESLPVSYKRGSWLLFTNQRFKIDNYSVISMNGFFRFRGLQQFYELGTLGSMNFNINRQFLNKKLTVTLSVTDVFFDNNYTFSLQHGTVNAMGYRESDTRRFGLNVRYNFGLRKKEEPVNIFNVEPPEKQN